MTTLLRKRGVDALDLSPIEMESTALKLQKIEDPLYLLPSNLDDVLSTDFACQSLVAPSEPDIIDLTGLSDCSDKPEMLEELCNDLQLAVQGEFSQLENLLLDSDDTILSELTLPLSRKDFILASKGEKTMLLPLFIDIGGYRYIKNQETRTFFGGYGAVAFYKCLYIELKPPHLPDVVALKVGKCPVEDLEDLVDGNYDLSETKSHWMREFMVQMRLKRCFFGCERNQLPFVDLFAASIAEVEEGEFQAFSVLEAGVCDLFHLFTTCPFNDPKKKANDLKSLLRVMQSTAESLSKLHQVKLHHGDVKLANVLVDNKSGGRAIFMDFDGSVFTDEDTTCDTYTVEYVSPQRKEDDENYDQSADDCWALGISFLIALTLKKSPIENMPFNVIKSFDMRFHLKLFMLDINLPNKTKNVLETVVCGLLTPEEETRMSAYEAAKLLKSTLYQ